MLSGRKVVISTGTKTLQDQIARIDLPRLRAMLPQPFDLVGHERARQLPVPAAPGGARRGRRRWSPNPELDRILRLGGARPHTGDRADLADLPDDAPLWREISATPETRARVALPVLRALLRDRHAPARRRTRSW